MDRKHLAETVSRRDADAEPPRMGSRRVSARCLWFMSVVNNGFGYRHWHRDMNCESPPKTRREPIHGGSNPASMRDTVFGSDSQSMPLILCGTVVAHPPLILWPWILTPVILQTLQCLDERHTMQTSNSVPPV